MRIVDKPERLKMQAQWTRERNELVCRMLDANPKLVRSDVLKAANKIMDARVK